MAGLQDRIKLLKGTLLILAILLLTSLIFKFFPHRRQTTPGTPDSSAAQSDTAIQLEGIRHTDIRDGKKDWVLTAESADYHLEENMALLSKLKATFIDQDGDNVYLSAESGIWRTDSNDLEVSGDVVLKNNQYEMRTDRLQYTQADRIFATRSPVGIHGFSMNQTADGMTYYMDTKTIVLDGNVEGEFGNEMRF